MLEQVFLFYLKMRVLRSRKFLGTTELKKEVISSKVIEPF